MCVSHTPRPARRSGGISQYLFGERDAQRADWRGVGVHIVDDDDSDDVPCRAFSGGVESPVALRGDKVVFLPKSLPAHMCICAQEARRARSHRLLCEAAAEIDAAARWFV